MKRVRNRVTGLVHPVPAGHPALTDGKHEVLPDEPNEPKEKEPAEKPRKRKKGD